MCYGIVTILFYSKSFKSALYLLATQKKLCAFETVRKTDEFTRKRSKQRTRKRKRKRERKRKRMSEKMKKRETTG